MICISGVKWEASFVHISAGVINDFIVGFASGSARKAGSADGSLPKGADKSRQEIAGPNGHGKGNFASGKATVTSSSPGSRLVR